ncbi:MAG: hypothetical protein AB4372_12570 [Xenococcus sp. (in: cyanobacteria)]
MSKNIVNRLFTTFLLLIAIILAQDMTQKHSDRGLTIRIERPKSRVVNSDSDSYPVKTRKNYMSEKPEPTERTGLVTSYQ